MKKYIFLSLTLILGLVACNSKPTPVDPRTKIEGRLMDKGTINPIPNTRVRLIEVNYSEPWLTPASQVIISTKNRHLTVFRRNMFKRNKTLISFQKIKQFIVNEEFDVDGNPKWKVDLQLKSGEIIELTKIWNVRNQCVETVKKANQLLNQNS